MWNNALATRIEAYQTGILSIVDHDEYPLSIRCQIHVDAQRQVITIPEPPSLAKSWRGRACLLFHRHNARLEGLHQMVVLGNLQEENGLLTFQVEKFLTANGRQDSDEMPHASSPFHMAKFMWTGWRNARAYITKRGKPWPPIPYDEISQKLANEQKTP